MSNFNNSNDPNSFGGFGQPFPGPEGLRLAGKTVRFVFVGGVPIPVSGEQPVLDIASGEVVTVHVLGSVLHDDSGLPFPAETFLGLSWSGLRVFAETR